MDHFQEEPAMPVHHFDLCCICLRQTCGNFLLVESQIGDTPLKDVIQNIFGVELVSGQDVPEYVCECCLRKVECLHNFREELIKCQILLRARQRDPAEEYLSDEIFEQVEKLEGNLGCEEGITKHHTESDSSDFDGEQPLKEQLIDIKIETLGDANELLVEHLSESEVILDPIICDPDDVEEDEFLGFEEPIPVKLEIVPSKRRNPVRRKHKEETEKLEVMESIPNKCYICNDEHDDENSFEMHLANHTDMLPYACPQCSTESSPIEIKTLRLLNKHFESHGFNFSCSLCPLRFRSNPPLYDHMRNVHVDSSEGFDCEICGVKFSEVRKFRKHMLAHKNRELERYKCQTCGKTFQTGTILRRHERIHGKEVLFLCPFCGRGFNHESNFQQHRMRHIKQQKKTQDGHSCTVCGTHFTTALDLRNHLAEHFPDDPLYTTKLSRLPENLKDAASYPRPCEEPNCQYVAPSYTLMWSHYRNHYKMFACAECDRKFGTATILKQHVEVVHRKIRKFQCELCEKTFAYQHKFKEHMDSHKGIRRRKCRYCEKTFTHSSNLLVHERIHTSTKPYNCTVCGSKYVTSSALKKHQRTHQKKNHQTEHLANDESYLGMVQAEDDELVFLVDAVEGMQDVMVAGEEEVVVN